MWKFSLSSLRSRAIVLVLLAILPLLGLTLYSYFDQRHQAIREVQRNELVVARNLATIQETMINDARQLLATLAQMPQVQRRDRDACHALFAELLKHSPQIVSIGATDSEGRLFASAPAVPGQVNFADSLWFQKIGHTRDLVIGETVLGRISGKLGNNLAYPIWDSEGRFQGALTTQLDLERLGGLLAKSDFPPATALALTDSSRKVLYRYPEPEKYIGRTFSDILIKAMTSGDEGVAAGVGLSGDARLFAFVRLSPPRQEMWLVIGLPQDWAVGPVNRALGQNLMWLGLVALFAMVSAWYGGDLFVVRPVRELQGVTARLAAGDLTVRAGPDYPVGELGLLAHSFDQMAASLQEREVALRESQAQLQTIFDNLTEGVFVSTLDGQFLKWNRAALKMHGFASVEECGARLSDAHDLFEMTTMDGAVVPFEQWPLSRILRGEQLRDLEVRVRRRDTGLEHIFNVSGDLVRDQDGTPLLAIVSQTDITERQQAEEAVKYRLAIISGINRIFRESLICETEEKLGETCLAVAEELTGSKFGFIEELNKEGLLDSIAISYLGWEACKIPGTEKLVLPKSLHIRLIYGPCLQEGRSEIVNDPPRHPDSIGVPAGHPSITAFLGVPLKHSGRTIGIIGLGNKEGGYTEEDRETVEALAPVMVEAFMRKRAEAALRESREDLNRAQAVAQTGSWRLDVQRNELTWSDETYHIFGISPGTAMTYETFLGTVHQEDREYVAQKWTMAMQGEPYDLEHRIVVDGRVKWVRERAELEFDPQGQLLGGFGTAQDITERKQIEKALRVSRERLQLFIEHAPAALAMFDRQMRYLSASRRWLSDYGLGDRDIVGLSYYEVFPEIPERWKEAHRRGLAGEVVRAEGDRFERLDGSVQWLRWEVRPWYDASGGVAGIVIFTEDITESQRAEEALRQSYQRLDLLAETASQLLASVAPQQVVDAICQKVMEFLHCDAFFNFLVDEKAGRLRLNACAGIPEEEARRLEWLDYGVAVCGCAAQEGCRIVTEDILNTPDPRTDLVKSYGIQAYACHPLLVEGRVLGTLSFGTRSRSSFTVDELSLMKAVADQVAIAMDRKLAEEALHRLNKELEQRVEMRTKDLQATVFQLQEEVRERLRAEEASRAASAYARSLIEASLDPLVTISPEGKITDVNRATEEATGIDRERLIGTDFSDYFTDPAQARDGYQQVLAQGLVRDFPLALRHASGRIMDVLYHATVYRNQAGEVQGVFAAARDITVRKQVEQQAARLGRLYRLLSKVYEAIVHAQDQEGLFSQACRIIMEEGDFLHCWIGRVDWEAKCVRAAAQFDLGDDYSKKITISLEDVPEGRGPTGTAVREGRWDTCLDIAGDPRMAPWREQALAHGFRSSAAFPLFMGGKVEGVLTLYSGQKGFFNKEEVAVLNSLAQDLSFAMESMDREAKRRQAEEEIRRLNEELEQRVRERTAELEFANRELESFTYSVSHDLKAPVRAIQGFSRMLEVEHASQLDAEGLRLLKVVTDNTKLMHHLIDDLLALSRLGRLEIRKGRVNLTSMARQVFHRLREQAPGRDLRLTMGDLPPGWGDQSLLYQVMENLLNNAIKYTRSRKTAVIEVGGQEEEQETIYYVKDNGIGFEARYAEKVFGVFHRLHGREEYEGTGVGLAIVKRIIERHGGRVWAEGKVDEGATFYFALPKARE